MEIQVALGSTGQALAQGDFGRALNITQQAFQEMQALLNETAVQVIICLEMTPDPQHQTEKFFKSVRLKKLVHLKGIMLFAPLFRALIQTPHACTRSSPRVSVCEDFVCSGEHQREHRPASSK